MGRDRAMPHIKSYTRISPDLKSIPWFVLTSANLSKGAWGVQRNSYYITNYEAGIVFIPKFIVSTILLFYYSFLSINEYILSKCIKECFSRLILIIYLTRLYSDWDHDISYRG